MTVPQPGRPNGAINLNNFFGLHPALAPFKPFYDAGQLAVVVATGGVDPTRSHFDAMRYMEQATPGNKTTGTGWLARHLETKAALSESPFRAVGFGSLVQSSLRGSASVSALALESIADFHLQGRSEVIDRCPPITRPKRSDSCTTVGDNWTNSVKFRPRTGRS